MGTISPFNVAWQSVAPSSTYAIIMAGGVGSRLEPYSTPNMPKQFLPIVHQHKSMLTLTYDRLVEGGMNSNNIFVATMSRYKNMVKKHISGVPTRNIIAFDGESKGTGVSVAAAMGVISKKDPKAVVGVLAADHWIKDDKAFMSDFSYAAGYAAEHGALMVFGIRPNHANIGYGYIRFDSDGALKVHSVLSFKEKPNFETAQSYVDLGDYFWNSGIYVFPVKTFDDLLRRYKGKVYDAMKIYIHNAEDMANGIKLFFEASDRMSFERDVLEPASTGGVIKMLELKTEWSDIGTWDSISYMVKSGKIPPFAHIMRYLNERNNPRPELPWSMDIPGDKSPQEMR